MKMLVKVLFMVIITISNLYSQEIYKTEYKLIHKFDNIPFGTSEGGKGSLGVDDMAIDSNGNFIFIDAISWKILTINSKFEIIQSKEYSNPKRAEEKYLYVNKDYLFIGGYGGYLYSHDKELNGLNFPFGYIIQRNFQIIEDLIIGEKEGNYYSYQIPVTMDDEVIFRDQNKTLEFLKSRKGFEIEDDFVFYDDRLITTLGKTFIEYFHPNKTKEKHYKTVYKRCFFIGIDKEENYYFSEANWIYVFDKNGELFQVVASSHKFPFTFPRVDPGGNIYYSHQNLQDNTIDLYKIDRVW